MTVVLLLGRIAALAICGLLPAWSVGLSVGHDCEPCKSGWTDRTSCYLLVQGSLCTPQQLAQIFVAFVLLHDWSCLLL